MPSLTHDLPGDTWQPWLKTDRELKALDALECWTGAHTSAEALRWGLRSLCKLLDELDEGRELVLTDVDGNNPREALSPEVPGRDEQLDDQRRWTVKANFADRERCARIQAWSGAENWRQVWQLAVVRMGELATELAQGAVLWSCGDGDEYRLVLL